MSRSVQQSITRSRILNRYQDVQFFASRIKQAFKQYVDTPTHNVNHQKDVVSAKL